MICSKCKNRIFDHVCVDMCDEEVCPNRYTKGPTKKDSGAHMGAGGITYEGNMKIRESIIGRPIKR